MESVKIELKHRLARGGCYNWKEESVGCGVIGIKISENSCQKSQN